jgi:hypothetical protein
MTLHHLKKVKLDIPSIIPVNLFIKVYKKMRRQEVLCTFHHLFYYTFCNTRLLGPFPVGFKAKGCPFPLFLCNFTLGFLRLLRAPHARGVHDQIFSKKPKNWRHTHGKKDDCV